jgi:predicted enzyme related to lactoylglutathione lyase
MQYKRLSYFIGVACIILAPPVGYAETRSADVAVAPQYDSTHVYVSAEDFERFVASLVATFGGKTSKQSLVTVTPTPSQTMSQLVMTPVGTLSVFGFKTPVPYPFGSERTGYLVKDLDEAVRAARSDGASVIVAPYPDAIGRDVLIQWPGGVNMQLYWHTTAPAYDALQTVPENRVYVSPDHLAAFTRAFLEFSHGTIRADTKNAPGVEVGKPGEIYHDILLDSRFGKMNVIATDGHLPWPYGREITGYEVNDLSETLEKARANGVSVLTPPVASRGRQFAMLEFPGGYIAEVHSKDAHP